MYSSLVKYTSDTKKTYNMVQKRK